MDEGVFPPGTLLVQRYRVVSLLGRGGMGEVYRANDLLLGQTVALKFLAAHAKPEDDTLERFRHEVCIARQVSHPNVCRVYDIGEAGGATYLSMEYVDGEDLASLLRRIGHLPADKALEIARQLCAGLAAAHDKGVLHRDLKPGNIMLDGRGQLRITDFGLAGMADEVKDIRSGTPGYMAPEQRSGRAVTARSDIYSLGIVLHEVFTGKHPSADSRHPDLVPEVDDIIRRCLAEDPARRPASALQVAAALPGGDTLAAVGSGGRRPIVSLAVLPLVNLSGDPAQDFFADGMTDELITHLMKVEPLRVASRTSVMGYKNASQPMRQIARELNVAWVVEGTVLYAKDRVRITARVIDGSTDQHSWAGSYERDLRDVLGLQSEVAASIAREIGVKLTATEQARLDQSRPVNPQAYEAYLRGRYLWNHRTRDALRRAVECFRQAIDQDPTYAPSHAGLADAYSLLGSIGYDGMPPREAMPLAKAAALDALHLDGTLAEAHASLGYVKLSYDWDWAGAEAGFQHAIALNPSYATAYDWYGHCLFAMGRLDEAAVAMRRALALDPLSIPCNLGVGWSFYYARQYDRAIDQYRKTLEIAPDLPMVLYELGLAYQNQGLYREALAVFQKGYERSGGESAAVMLLGHAYALSGQTVEALQELKKLEERSQQEHVPALYRAFLYAGLNDKDQAFRWFEQAYEDRCNYLIYLAVEPSLDNLRSDPRYLELLRRVGLAD